jgi:hypothetical protein
MDAAREIVVRKSSLRQQGHEDDLDNVSLEQRLEMVWPLTVSAWAIKGEDIASQRLQRHAECVERRRR